MNRYTIISLVSALALNCSGPMQSAGGSSDSGNPRVVAIAYTADGTPAAGATVRLRKADYLSPLPSLAKKAGVIGADALTDESGQFAIDNIEPGSYSIEVNDGRSAVLLSCSLDVRDTMDLGRVTLREFATVKGAVDLTGSPKIPRYVQIFGMDRLASVDSAGGYAITGLPAAVLRLRVVALDTTVKPLTVDGVVATPGMVTEVPLAGWRFSKRLVLNTTGTGANVGEDVLHFPLLVRLDGSTSRSTGSVNFDFTQCDVNGADLRFTKSDGTSLPYEIEQWDRVNRRAAIWVLMDTVRGNDATQCLFMNWGNPSAPGISTGAAVFDTANGFAGVWHLAEEQPDTGSVDLYKDATANRFHGSDNISSTEREGVIGFGHGFDSTRMDHINLGSDRDFVGGASAVTLEAWVKLATNWAAGGTVITHSVSAAVVPHTSHAYLLADTRTRVGGRCLESDPEQAITTDTILLTATWYHVTGVIDYQRDSLCLFVNGEPVMAGVAGFSLPALPAGSSTSSAIGSDEYPFSKFFNGSLDEVRTQRVRRSAGWIKLCYENQKSGPTVVVHSMP